MGTPTEITREVWLLLRPMTEATEEPKYLISDVLFDHMVEVTSMEITMVVPEDFNPVVTSAEALREKAAKTMETAREEAARYNATADRLLALEFIPADSNVPF